MSDYLLDTNILSYWYDIHCPEHTNVLSRVSLVRQPDPRSGYVSRLFISVITLGEIEYGHHLELSPDVARQADFATFVREHCPEPLDLTPHLTQQYGVLKAWLFNNCSPKTKRTRERRLRELTDPTTAEELGADENDLWIAAQAMTHNLTLVTHDKRGNFGRVLRAFRSELCVDDWA